MTAPIVTADSITRIGDEAAGAVVVNASHGGIYAAYLAAKLHAAAAIFNDAGIGKDRAGIGGLSYLDALGIAAATIGHDTARIGDGADMLARGVVTHANALAAALRVWPGLPCAAAAALLQGAQPSDRSTLPRSFCPSTGTPSSLPARTAGCSAADRRPRSNTMSGPRSITTPGSASTRPACRGYQRSTLVAFPPPPYRRQARGSATRAPLTRTE
jgi:hypothetical protein